MTDLNNLIGYVGGKPVWLFRGADAPVVEVDDEPDDEPDNPPAETWAAPSKEQWERAQARLKTANKEAADRRKWLESHGIDPRTGERIVDHDVTPEPTPPPAVDRTTIRKEIDAAVAKAVAKTELRYKPALQANAIKRALDESGVDPGFRGLITKALDTSDLEFDEDGNGVGLEDQIAALKVEYPSAFKSAAPAVRPRRTGGAAAVDGGQKPPPPPVKRSWLESLDSQFTA